MLVRCLGWRVTVVRARGCLSGRMFRALVRGGSFRAKRTDFA